MKNVIITEIKNPSSEGVILCTNIPTKLKTGNVASSEFWVSWDKIGAALLHNYTEDSSVDGRNKLRNQNPQP